MNFNNLLFLNIPFFSVSHFQMFKEDFDLLLEYLVDLKGKSREKTKEDAEKVLKTSGSFFGKIFRNRESEIICVFVSNPPP